MNKWISCEDRLPEKEKDVLVYNGVDMFVAWRTCWHFDENADEMWTRVEERWRTCDDSYVEGSFPILAWMPLPTPPSTVRLDLEKKIANLEK